MLTPIKGSKRIMEEQQQALREYQAALTAERNDKANLVNLIARVLDDYDHHACITDDTLNAVKTKHKEIMG